MHLSDSLEVGNKVIFIGCADDQLTYNPGSNDPRPIIKENSVYQIDNIEVRDWSTLIKLKDFDGWFPSVCFKLYVDKIQNAGYSGEGKRI